MKLTTQNLESKLTKVAAIVEEDEDEEEDEITFEEPDKFVNRSPSGSRERVNNLTEVNYDNIDID